MTMVASLAVCILLVNLCWSAPAPTTNDVLSGQDFLAVFMRSSPRTRSVPSSSSSPSSSYYINRNLIQQNNNDNNINRNNNHNNNNSYYNKNNKVSGDYEIDRDDHNLTNEDNIISRTSITKSTHVERDFEDHIEPEEVNEEPSEVEEVNTLSATVDSSSATDLVTTTDDISYSTTTEQPSSDSDTELPSQVVSVRVSSSVVRQRPRQEEKPVIAGVQDEPVLTAAAVQRSHFEVEESTGSVAYKITSDEPEERVSYSQEATVLRIEGRQSSSRRPLLSHHQLHQQQQQRQQQDQTQQDSYAEASQEFASAAVVQPILPPHQQQRTEQQQQHQARVTLIQPTKLEHNIEKLSSPAPPVKNVDTRSPEPASQTVPNYSQAQALTYHPIDLQIHPGNAPVTYETSVQSATSGSRVQFYSEPPAYRLQSTDKRKDRRFDLSEFQEKVYGEPEKNYEVDEAVSVMTNGRAHGVQHHQRSQGVSTVQTPEADHEGHNVPGNKPPSAIKEDDNNKFGYVVEDRNYRKYRVEEKTPDGFIVGEYGVVSHDDGSLRGVRYTADSTINPRLIYDALVKFLSLK